MKKIIDYGLLSLLTILPVAAVCQQTAPVWEDYVRALQNGSQSLLPDFSYAGYHFSEQDLPDVSGRKYFNVTDYGAIPDDSGYDDEAIQRAVNAAQGNPGGGVVYFPPGRYLISPNGFQTEPIRISKSHVVLKGSGCGEGGTEIFQDKMQVRSFRFRFNPFGRRSRRLTVITADAPRETFWVEVADPAVLKVGQNVVITHRSEAYARLYFDSLPLAPGWSRLFGQEGGMNICEIHTIEQIRGNRIKFKNPIHLNIRIIKNEDFALYTYTSLQECGIEDILFTSNWGSYPETFKHHKDAVHDAGWCALSMEYVEDSWIRNCEFRDLNESVFIRAGYKVTLQNVIFSGKAGHSTVHTRSGYGVLISECYFNSNTHHGPGTGYGGVGTVVTHCTMQPNQNIDSHSGQPYATLFDDIQGGVFKNIGGAFPGFPHHGKYLVFWNFRHRSTYDFHYKFWDTERRRNHTFARPIFVGFQANRKITFEDVGLNQLPGQMVEPRSLFEAQLALRLKRL